MQPAHRRKNIFRCQVFFQLADALQLESQDIQQNLGIRLRIDMPQFIHDEVPFEFFAVGEVPVMRQGNSVGRVDVKRLRFGGG